MIRDIIEQIRIELKRDPNLRRDLIKALDLNSDISTKRVLVLENDVSFLTNKIIELEKKLK